MKTDQTLIEQITKAVAAYKAMSPEDKMDHDYEQRRSFVRGQCPSNRNYIDWCGLVDEILPPRR